jgi:hypothetical protein
VKTANEIPTRKGRSGDPVFSTRVLPFSWKLAWAEL